MGVKLREGTHMADADGLKDGVSAKTDELASQLLGKALDVLAVGEDLYVLLAVQDKAGNIASYEFAEDGPEECLDGARAKVGKVAAEKGDAAAGLGDPVRYALTYRGAVEDEEGAYQDAVILEFGEKGYRSFSAFSLVDVTGDEDTFGWTEPAPAGEVDALL